ncbi:hypothetical protein R5W23_005719 [Gemmata sp. JC673]|uniref:Lipoprotein n=1 Tax=Gemmata algarum TaxID=2975278 RepID=A0ABU5EVC9_9BACT|nr:hypothetical protein [Gemmata algarum]MDY3558597.1 hypothetical protein [Gemmata algarum]
MWYALAIVAALVGYWSARYWLAFRRVRALQAGLDKLGDPLGRTRAEVAAALGPPTRVPEPTADEELMIWVEKGRFSLLDAYTVSAHVEARMRFRDGVCVTLNDSGGPDPDRRI